MTHHQTPNPTEPVDELPLGAGDTATIMALLIVLCLALAALAFLAGFSWGHLKDHFTELEWLILGVA